MHHPLAVPYLFLCVTVVGAVLAINAQRPFARAGRLSFSAFFAGWLTSELPIQHLVLQVLATGLFVWLGALRAWPGHVGLGIAFFSWFGLVRMFLEAGRAGTVIERALVAGLGSDYLRKIEPAMLEQLSSPQPLSQILLPLAMRGRTIERIVGLSYGPYGRRNHLDIHRLRGASLGRRPVLVQVHGGAWVVGNKEQQGLPLIYYLVSLGWVCVSVNYRLSPRATFPDHIVDVKRALAWVKANIASYGGDPGFVVISGGSAGGHLSALAALTPNDPAYQPGFEDADTSVQACVPLYGVYDFTNRKGLGRKDMRAFLARVVLKRPFDEAREVFDRASPMSRVNQGAPPFLVLHGTHDSLVPVEEARLFVELLRETSRAEVVYAEMPGAQHAFEVFASARTGHVVRGIARFLEHVRATRSAPALGVAADRTQAQIATEQSIAAP